MCVVRGLFLYGTALVNLSYSSYLRTQKSVTPPVPPNLAVFAILQNHRLSAMCRLEMIPENI